MRDAKTDEYTKYVLTRVARVVYCLVPGSSRHTAVREHKEKDCVVTKREVKVGVHRGGGPEPGYLWSVKYLTIAENEARRILQHQHQYDHVVDQIRDLARHTDPTHPSTQNVEKFADFFELKEKGGPLGRINLRVFFIVQQEQREIVLLGHYKKEVDGATPRAVVRKISRRARKYYRGDYAEQG